MAKYLIRASYTTEGVKGLIKDGGSKRVRAVEEALGPLGGKVRVVLLCARRRRCLSRSRRAGPRDRHRAVAGDERLRCGEGEDHRP